MISSGNRGQSLIELLIALGIGVLIIIAGISATNVALRVRSQNEKLQPANFLSQELTEDVSVISEGSWIKIASTTPGVNYYASSTAGNLNIFPGTESKIINGITYTRSFQVDKVCRDASDSILSDCSSGVEDNFTKKVTITVSWNFQGSSSTNVITKYLTRTDNRVLWQKSWSGGPTTTTDPVTTGTITIFYSTPTGTVDFSSEPGILKIQGY